MSDAALQIAVVGHTNAGKTSLLRTLTRNARFGNVSDTPGTTRHAETIALRFDGRTAVRFVDTPGLEDSVALLAFLMAHSGETKTERVRAFLHGPEAHGTFEQEAKVLRALVTDSDAGLLVIDTRETVLPKYRAEIEILSWCARPLMPVLNFVRDPASRRDDWHQALLESNLHARVEFDAVAPFATAEPQLYRDLGALLPERREELAAIVDALALQQRQRRVAASRVIAQTLIDVAAMRRSERGADPESFLRDFRDAVRRHADKGAAELLALFAFRPGDAELAALPELAGRWTDDLFNPELLKKAGSRLGWGAAVGAGVGAAVDVVTAGISLGGATALGATLGGALSGGWRPLWRKLENRLTGTRELTVEEPVLLLLAERLCRLALALTQRGHAALERLRITDADADASAADELRAVVGLLGPARGHAEWERGPRRFRDEPERARLQDRVAERLLPLLDEPAENAAPPLPEPDTDGALK
jgi:GTPase Era involved in 16S rRNA processing